MNPKTLIALAILTVGGGAIAAANLGWATQRGDAKVSGMDRAELEEFVHQYIMDNPEVLIDSLNEYTRREQARAVQTSRETARDALPMLASDKGGFVTGKGKDDPEVVVIEFFDYHCGYCKSIAGFAKELASTTDGVKFVYREYPILRRESDIAAEFALAARAQGKYEELHYALLAESGILTEDRILSVANGLGINTKRLSDTRKAEGLSEDIQENYRIANEIGIDGTPAFVIATPDGSFVEVVIGNRPREIVAAIEAARNGQDNRLGAGLE